MSALKFVAAGIVIVALLAGLVSCEVSLWRECRTDHSWYYCMRVINK